MSYSSLEACLLDLEKHGHLLRVREEVDPELEMAAIHLRVHAAAGPALLFERVKGSRFRAASNLFGSLERSRFLFRDTLEQVQRIIQLKENPLEALRHPLHNSKLALAAIKALPYRNPPLRPATAQRIAIHDLPQIKHWPGDGGSFVTLPQVYTEDPQQPGIRHANIGMYRIQLSGNDYRPDEEIGLHYQLHRGIGVHQSKWNALGQPMKVSVFVGGPPAHTLAAVMPLPEGISEALFAGLLGGRRFRYFYDEAGYCISSEADFVITGEVLPGENKPEGPFGDHLGYYSLRHDFPLMRVKKVFARKDAIWPFTVVGRPPQEDTSFGALIHEITGDALPTEIPGLKEIHAVDAAGVHPLLLAIGREGYTPYDRQKQPAEILTIAHHILGTGQLSLAKFLFITADDSGQLHTKDIPGFFRFVLERLDFSRDIHFHTHTTIDTLDYSGTGLNTGSKVVLAAYGEKLRDLATEMPAALLSYPGLGAAKLALPGIVALQAGPFENYEKTTREMATLDAQLRPLRAELSGIALIVVCDDAAFAAASLNNFLWVSFTRANPSHDLWGIHPFTEFKHWGCRGPLVIDARIKPHHAPPLVMDESVNRRVDRLFQKGGSLESIAS
ncbi:MAG: UbiD family decarboxylase [Bacteroidetes bacterium]|nr:UbiD family decarboxylase [Bacteroidota bacterium]